MLNKILQNEHLQEVHGAFQNGESVLIEGLWNGPKALLAALAQRATGKNVLILTGTGQEESRLFDDFVLFTERPVIDFPAWETMPSENIAPSPDVVGERYKVLQAVLLNKQPHIILASLQACLQKLISPDNFQELHISLRVGQNYSFEKLILLLTQMGYTRRPIASDKGEYAVRGGIIDIFPVSSPDPYRLEFWGDEIESIRFFDPIGQKSVREGSFIDITPAQEMELLERSSQLCSILDYVGKETIVVFDDLLALEDRYASLVSLSGIASKSFMSIESFLDQLEPLQKIYLSSKPIEELSEVKVLEKVATNYYSARAAPYLLSFQMFNREFQAKRWHHPFEYIAGYLLPNFPEEQELSGQDLLLSLSQLADKECELYLLCSTSAEENTLQKKILDFRVTLPKHTHFQLGYLSTGFVVVNTNTIVLPYPELTHRYKIRRQKMRSTYHTAPSEFQDLVPGETVVHLNNGIGRYLGIEWRANNAGIPCEFLIIEYAENSRLYVPVSQAHLISKYIGAGEETPRFHTLGSNRWKKTREQTERAILGYAKELLELYAQRTIKGGFAFGQDSDAFHLFEEEFPYVETEDQLGAINAIKEDMCSSKSMDRLICGDVGYGKTEVAMRACFKAVVDGQKQVAILVPTTVLALQHYENFVARMANFPVNVGMVSRFMSAKQNRETLEGIRNGTIDVLIGTHRIISEDVVFKNLGLVVIDEEQRFGVKAKEHLKKVKVGVDCLTLSATPIPRTLYMSMIGARDVSVINTPPQDRLPIKTVISEPNEQVVRNALLRELNRDGQAYFIHNRVETIYEAASHLKKLLPQARIVVAHGQMGADEIDEVFHAFKSGRADILVATTIVENGIDIPNANTILIDKAHTFGLADLYQLRGRVGRWNRRAYAYFLVPRLHALPEISRKRLNALAESSGYGGGMKVAMRDLEIRGAGDILGLEQSGHVSAIGFHLYCKLLKRMIKTLQGKVPRTITDTKMEFFFDARLPEDYINESNLRLEIYQRLGESFTLEDVDLTWEELNDRFGKPPEPAQWLYYLTRIRVYASEHQIRLLKFEKGFLTVEGQKGKESILKKLPLVTPKDPAVLETQVLKILNDLLFG